MNYPCSMIQDLLPLYVDGVCSAESRSIVEKHVAECPACSRLLSEMQADLPTDRRQKEMDIAGSLKRIKKKINSRIFRIFLGAAMAVALVAGGIFVLFSEPLKPLGPADVEMSAEVYDLRELAALPSDTAGDGPTAVFADDTDNSRLVDVEIPGFGQVTISEETILENPQLAVISMASDYHLRIVHWDVEGDTLYVSKMTTTLLGNEAKDGREVSVSLHFEGFDRIVYRPEGGAEEILMWSRK